MELDAEEMALMLQTLSGTSPGAMLEYLGQSDCLAEQAWFAARRERLERDMAVSLAVAYLKSRGELPGISLCIPAGDGDDDF